MAGTTNLLQWNPTAVNQENDTAYLADSQRAGGAVDPSFFASVLANKAFYQWSTYLVALFTAFANKGFTTSDSNLSTLTAQCANFLTTSDVEPQFLSVAYAPNVTLDLSQSLGFEITLTGDISITVTNARPGQVVVVLLNQGGSGGHAATWTNAYAPGTADPTATAVSLFSFKVDGVSHLLPIAPVVSNLNGIVGTPIGAAQPSTGRFTTLTLAAPGTAGQVLTNVGGLFVPQSPGFVSVTNANGTYRVSPDSVIECWGSVTLPATGSATATATFAFPTGFSSPPKVQLTSNGYSRSAGGPDGMNFAMASGVTTSGATANGMCPVPAGGGAGGGSFDQPVPVAFYAIGK